MSLDANEKRLANAAFHQGPEALLAEGYTREGVTAFVERKEVQEYWLFLKREYDIYEGLRARSKFAALRNLNMMIGPASAVIAQSLAGPSYLRDNNGVIMRGSDGEPMITEAEPSRQQLSAAKFVINSVGVMDHKIQGDAASDPSLKLLFATGTEEAVVLDDDPTLLTEEQRALSRERIRNVIHRFTDRVVDVGAKVRSGMSLEAPREHKEKKVKKGVLVRKRGERRAKKKGR